MNKSEVSLLTVLLFLLPFDWSVAGQPYSFPETKPHIILVMADDQGWGQTGYNNHPVLRTPNLDGMAANGLRFDRFYAAAPVCSPTRAAVLTGRTNRRTGVESHGHALRLQEKTVAQALQKVGYATGHFGKWHLNGMRGPGVPIFDTDTHHPGKFGFDTWLSVTNYFDRDPLLSRKGKFEPFTGDSSEIVVDEALKFIQKHAKSNTPSFTVIWFGTPHSPFRSADNDSRQFSELDNSSKDHYGELVAMDRSIGTLRKSLRDMGIADNTLLWFTSDNGGLPKIVPETVGGLRGNKGSVYEGGLRVPGIVEWPSVITPRITKFPAVSMDIFPTIAEIVGLPAESMIKPVDGLSLRKLFEEEIQKRNKPIPFACLGNKAVIIEDKKLVWSGKKKKNFELYDLTKDPTESNDLIATNPELGEVMKEVMAVFDQSIDLSVKGADYPGSKLNESENPAPRFWHQVEGYKPYFDRWMERPEYGKWLRGKLKSKK